MTVCLRSKVVFDKKNQISICSPLLRLSSIAYVYVKKQHSKNSEGMFSFSFERKKKVKYRKVHISWELSLQASPECPYNL
jgi:hypothetical protein